MLWALLLLLMIEKSILLIISRSNGDSKCIGHDGEYSRQAYINLTLTRRDKEETTVDKLRIKRGQQAEDDNKLMQRQEVIDTPKRDTLIPPTLVTYYNTDSLLAPSHHWYVASGIVVDGLISKCARIIVNLTESFSFYA